MKIRAWHDAATNTQYLAVEIPNGFVNANCESLGAAAPSQPEAHSRNAVLKAFGLKLSAPVSHRRSAGEVITGKVALAKTCVTCWTNFYGPDDECEGCRKL